MKVTIDREGCTACGICESLCSDVFVLEGGDKAIIVKKYQEGSPAEGKVDEQLADCVNEAAANCPVDVIKVSS